MHGRISIRFLISNALSLLGNSIAGVALPLILLATTGDAGDGVAEQRQCVRYEESD